MQEGKNSSNTISMEQGCSLGRHLLLELYACSSAYLEEIELLEPALNDAAVAGGATVVKSVFHQFNPHGLSGVVVIAESHLTVHTWPEHGYAAIDVFTCGGTVSFEKIRDTLIETMGAQRWDVQLIERGPKLGGMDRRLEG